MKTVKLEGRLKLYISNKKEDMEYIKSRSEEIYKILEGCYKAIGGCYIYLSVDKMLQMASRYKIVTDRNEQILAVATYRHFKNKNSFKCILMGRNYEMNAELGKIAVQWIIKSDIINWQNRTWIRNQDILKYDLRGILQETASATAAYR